MTRNSLFVGASGILVLAVVIAGLWTVISPSEQRERNLDAERVRNINAISMSIEQFYNRSGHLPESLQDLAKNQPPSEAPLHLDDPVTKAVYGYQTKGALQYDLCGTFALPSDGATTYPLGWKHEAGRHCFSLIITPRKQQATP